MAFLPHSALEKMGFAALGNNVKISDKVSLYNCEKISIGSNVRIDDFCVLSAGEGGICIGSYIHIAVYTSLVGAGRIELSDFCNLSSRVSIFSSNDDYSGSSLTNPLVDKEFKDVLHAEVFLGKHVIVGCGSVVLPGVSLEEGVAVGALSLIKENCEPFGLYVGVPAKRVKARDRNLTKLEARFLASRSE